MLQKEFDKLKIVNIGETTTLGLGEYFLSPDMEGQKASRKIGDTVTVYKVIEVRPNGNVVYTPVYLSLE